MITFTPQRTKDGRECKAYPRKETPMKALELLAFYELGYAAEVIEMTETRLVTRVGIMTDMVDTSIFEGSAEDMRPLIEFAALHLTAQAQHNSKIEANAIERCGTVLQGNPLYITLGLPKILGGERLKATMLVACRVSEEDFKLGMSLGLKDLMAAIQLGHEMGASLREVMQATAA